MKLAALAVALTLSACSFELPTKVDGSALQCVPDDNGPNCNGERRRDECAALGLFSAYGVDRACAHPVLPVGGACVERWQGTYRCVAHGDLLCCPGAGP